VRAVRRRITPAMTTEIKRFDALFRPYAELFPELLPAATATDFAGELALLKRGRAHLRNAMVRRMLGKRLMDQADVEAASRPAALRRIAREAAERQPNNTPLYTAYIASPADVLRDLCALLEAFVDCCGAAQWAEFEARARDDARARTQLLERFGIAGMLRTLSSEIGIGGDRRTASLKYGTPESADVRLALAPTSTLTLTPSYFIWPHVTLLVLRKDALDVRLAYPLASPSTIRPRVRAWEPAAKRFAALSDPTRLHMLDLLGDRDLSTREFAGLLGLSEGGVSRHLSILREANLVTSVRDGYFVLYRRAASGFDELAPILAGFSTSLSMNKPGMEGPR
jgi:DNA-binding transcriptional ArsR family regulator